MCAESLSGILDYASIILTSLSLIRNMMLCFFPPMISGFSTTTGGCRVMSLFTIQVCFYQFSDLICNFTSLSPFNPILILCKPSNL